MTAFWPDAAAPHPAAGRPSRRMPAPRTPLRATQPLPGVERSPDRPVGQLAAIVADRSTIAARRAGRFEEDRRAAVGRLGARAAARRGGSRALVAPPCA